jgi:transcriptional regulator NrdR family protein
MKCPICKQSTRVFATVKQKTAVYRRRECAESHRFFTCETVYTGPYPWPKKKQRPKPKRKSPPKPSREWLRRIAAQLNS